MPKVWVLVGAWSGCIDSVWAYTDKATAEREEEKLRKQYGIRKGHEGESDHAVELHELIIEF